MDLAHRPSTPSTADIPVSAYYAANELFRSVDAGWRFREKSNDNWEDFLLRAYKGRFTPATLEEIRRRLFTDPTYSSLLSYEEKTFRRLGQPVTQIDTTRIKNDRFYCVNGRRSGVEYEVMVMRHERDLISSSKCDSTSVISHLTLNRHALERIYEREGLRRRTELLPRIRDELIRAERYVAFAFAAGLYVGLGPRQPGAVTAVPFGEGLLFVRNSVVAMDPRHRPNTRFIYSKSGYQSKRLQVTPDQTTAVPQRLGNMVGYVVPVATTYISDELMHNRIEQQSYHYGFLDAVVGHDLQAISLDTSFDRLFVHERERPKPHKVEIDPRYRLHFLLSQIAKRTDPSEVWVPLGWHEQAAYLRRLAEPVLRQAA